MKIPILKTAFLFAFIFMTAAACGRGGTETGTSVPIDRIVFASKIESAVAALVPKMQDTDPSEQISRKSINYMSGSDWDLYLLPTTVTYLTDIFGPAGGHPAPETRIRVLMSRLKDTLEDLFTADPLIDCSGGAVLRESDTIEIAFYGDIPNGTEGDRHYKCISQIGGETYPSTILYGQDASGALRVVKMDVSDTWNEDHGYNAWNRSVLHVTYGEATENGTSRGYIDLQYAQAIIYDGDDAERHTEDDLIYKNRSRITGRVELDSSGQASLGTGDFSIIKYDVGLQNDGGGMMTSVKRSMGRGSYGDGYHSLFNISIDDPMLEGAAGIYCIQNTAAGLPAYAESANCQAFEEEIPWEDSAIPFEIAPAIESSFAAKPFYEANDTQLIDNAGNNFSIPSYATVE